jgi:rSAM/selenodomain-associated transferase 1
MICFVFLAFQDPEPPMSEPRQLLVTFLRFPEPGKVKTRLAAGVGAQEAAAIYRQLVALTFEAVASWADRPARSVWVAFDPANRETEVRDWLLAGPAGSALATTLRAQGDGDLGARLEQQFDDAFREGHERVVAIGSDCPDLTASVLEQAFAHLGSADVVLGPAVDGGYYLIGTNRPAPELFRGIPWSSPTTLAATLAAATASGRRVAVLPRLADVDTADEWRDWLARKARREGNKTT